MITFHDLPAALRHPKYEQYEVATTRSGYTGRVWRHTGTKVWHADLPSGVTSRKGFKSREAAAAYLTEFWAGPR